MTHCEPAARGDGHVQFSVGSNPIGNHDCGSRAICPSTRSGDRLRRHCVSLTGRPSTNTYSIEVHSYDKNGSVLSRQNVHIASIGFPRSTYLKDMLRNSPSPPPSIIETSSRPRDDLLSDFSPYLLRFFRRLHSAGMKAVE